MGTGMGRGKSYTRAYPPCQGRTRHGKNCEKHQNQLKWARRLIKMRRNTHDLVLIFFSSSMVGITIQIDRISGRFRSISIFLKIFEFLGKWIDKMIIGREK